jgi:hypothetical protein
MGTDLVERIRAYAAAKGWAHVFKLDDFEANILADIATDGLYTPGQNVLTFDVRYRPNVRNGKIVSAEARVLAALGRKTDADGTQADLAEAHEDKYDARLGDLMAELVLGMAELACEQGYEVTYGDVTLEVNVYDANIDFATCEVTFLIR